ncbi:hypothetical protein [Plantactinospora veratri]
MTGPGRVAGGRRAGFGLRPAGVTVAGVPAGGVAALGGRLGSASFVENLLLVGATAVQGPVEQRPPTRR